MKKNELYMIAAIICVCLIAVVTIITQHPDEAPYASAQVTSGSADASTTAVTTSAIAEVNASLPETTAPSETSAPGTVNNTAAGDNKGDVSAAPADTGKKMPQTNQEVIDKYTMLVDKFKKEKPAYKRKEYQNLPEDKRNFSSAINFILNIAAGYMVSEEDAEEKIVSAGSQDILNDMPIHGTEKGCALTDYDAVEWAKCEDLGDGTYKLSFSLKEEYNAEPTPADTLVPLSAHGAVMQPMAYSDIKSEVDKVANTIPGIAVNKFDLIYRDCEFSCVYDPNTDEVKSITHNIIIDIDADVALFGSDIIGSARLINEMLIYDITW